MLVLLRSHVGRTCYSFHCRMGRVKNGAVEIRRRGCGEPKSDRRSQRPASPKRSVPTADNNPIGREGSWWHDHIRWLRGAPVGFPRQRPRRHLLTQRGRVPQRMPVDSSVRAGTRNSIDLAAIADRRIARYLRSDSAADADFARVKDGESSALIRVGPTLLPCRCRPPSLLLAAFGRLPLLPCRNRAGSRRTVSGSPNIC